MTQTLIGKEGTTVTEKKTLASAMVEAQRNASAVAKGSRNDFHKYKYASAEAVIEEARGALVTAGLALLSHGWTVQSQAAERREKEPTCYVRAKYLLLHAYSEESLGFEIDWPVITEKGRPEDKAFASAVTTSLSYFLRGLLLLPREDEDAMDKRDDREYTPQRSPETQMNTPGAVADAVAKYNLCVSLFEGASTTEEVTEARAKAQGLPNGFLERLKPIRDAAIQRVLANVPS